MEHMPHVSLEELANGYCLAVGNAFRLVEDGEKLFHIKRYSGAAGLFRDAVNEVVKAHLIHNAVTLAEDDEAGWNLFWKKFRGWQEKFDVLETEIHPHIYRTDEAKARYAKAHPLLKVDFTRLRFHEEMVQFLPPGANLLGHGNDEEITRTLYEYVLGLFHAFNFGGLPNPKTQFETFRAMKFFPEKV